MQWFIFSTDDLLIYIALSAHLELYMLTQVRSLFLNLNLFMKWTVQCDCLQQLNTGLGEAEDPGLMLAYTSRQTDILPPVEKSITKSA